METECSFKGFTVSLGSYGSQERCHNNGKTHRSRCCTRRETRWSVGTTVASPLKHTPAKYFSGWSPLAWEHPANDKVPARRSNLALDKIVQTLTSCSWSGAFTSLRGKSQTHCAPASSSSDGRVGGECGTREGKSLTGKPNTGGPCSVRHCHEQEGVEGECK